MKNYILCLIPFICFACYIPKNLSKGKPVNKDVIAKIKPGKKYEIHQKSGTRILLVVTKCDSLMVYGRADYFNGAGGRIKTADYKSSFEKIIEDSDKIYLRKFNPYLTFGPLVILTAGLVYSVANMDYELDIYH
jgi:hypothetical protein